MKRKAWTPDESQLTQEQFWEKLKEIAPKFKWFIMDEGYVRTEGEHH
jgi:hypothetical protein